jgi:hypothetical protein
MRRYGSLTREVDGFLRKIQSASIRSTSRAAGQIAFPTAPVIDLRQDLAGNRTLFEW